jgi:hypothetical protein
MISTNRANNGPLSLVTGTVVEFYEQNSYVNTAQYGIIYVATNTGYVTAYPINVNSFKVPLPGEVVLLLQGPPSATAEEAGQQHYYISTIDTLNNINHNVSPIPRARIPQIVDSAAKNAVKLDQGLLRRNYQPTNDAVDDIDLQNKQDIDGQTDEYIDTIKRMLLPENMTSFNSKDVKPLQHFQGDLLQQSRFGNAIRLSSTHTINVNSPGEYERYPYWKGEQSNDPFIAITCGINDNDASFFAIENPDVDDSSIMLSSRQRIQNMTLSQPKRVKGFTAMTEYANPQIVITSDRLVFNSKQDEILLSGKKTVGIATPGWAMDMNKMFDILEGMLSELAALTSAQATFATGVGPSGPSTNAQAVQELLGSLRNMKQ